MKKSKILASTLLTGTLLANVFVPCFAQYNNYSTQPYSQNYNSNQNYNQNQNYNNYNSNYALPPLKGHVITVPGGTTLNAVSQAALSSEFLTIGDNVSVMINNGFYYNGSLVLPAGSAIQGNVVLAEKAGFAGKSGKLKIKFTSAVTPSGQRVPLSGKLATQDGTGLLVGGTSTERLTKVAKNTAVGSGLGALAGLIASSMSGGKIGKGTALSTAVGGGIGLAKSGIDKGNDATIPAGSNVDIVLDQPATINLNQSYNY